jgi:hypothetical protein
MAGRTGGACSITTILVVGCCGAKLRRCDAGADDAVGGDFPDIDRETAKRGAQTVEGQPEIEQRSEHHVA